MSRKIHLDAPSVGELEKRYLNQAIDKGFVSTVGPYVAEFEGRFSEYLRVKKAVSTQSGTSAIHLALHGLGIGKGDEVIVPALTFVATVNPVLYVGATPVFADVDLKTWNMDPREVNKCITKKTKAIIPVHLYGNPCNMDELNKIARENNIFIIEDVTESLGARYKHKFTGTFGHLGCFSFNGNKIITTGGGGMVVGDDIKLLNRIKLLVNQARDEAKEYYHPEVGFNARMTNIEAALGLAQMEQLQGFLEKKIKFNSIYRRELKSIESIRFQEEYPESSSSFWLTCIVFKKKVKIVSLQQELEKREIKTRRVFMPLLEFPPYQSYKKNNYKNSYFIYEKGLCLPSSTLNSEDDIHYVCNILRGVI